jgi:uncharacterized protein (TIGR04255 family)
MNKFPTLTKSPIQAAIIEIRFTDGSIKLPEDHEKKYLDLIKDKYPVSNKGLNRNIDINDAGGKQSVSISEEEVVEFRYISTDKNTTIVVRPNRFLISVNKAYSNWDVLSEEFKRVWEIYQKNFLDNFKIKYEGISTRFINRFEVSDLRTPSEYFNTTIYANDGIIPGTVDSYLMKYISNLPEDNVQVHVIQGFEPAMNNVFPYLFDIDVIHVKELSQDGLFDIMNRLREIKNQTFFHNLSQTTLNSLL